MEQEIAAWAKRDYARFADSAKRFVAAEISNMLAKMNCYMSEYEGYKKNRCSGIRDFLLISSNVY